METPTGDNQFMAMTFQELENFHSFSLKKLRAGARDFTLEELLFQWRVSQERDKTNADIREGLTVIEQGTHRLLDEFMDEFCTRHNISSDA